MKRSGPSGPPIRMEGMRPVLAASQSHVRETPSWAATSVGLSSSVRSGDWPRVPAVGPLRPSLAVRLPGCCCWLGLAVNGRRRSWFRRASLGLSWLVGAGEDRCVGPVAGELLECHEMQRDRVEAPGRWVEMPERDEVSDAPASLSSRSLDTSRGSTTPACTKPSTTARRERPRNSTLRKAGQLHPQNKVRKPTKTVSVKPRAAHHGSPQRGPDDRRPLPRDLSRGRPHAPTG